MRGMRRLFFLLLVASSALAQAPDAAQKLRDAQKAFGAGDCVSAQVKLHEILAADSQNYVAHLLTGHCQLRDKNYRGAAAEFRRALEIRADAPPALLALIQSYALAGDRAHRDAEIAHLRTLIDAGKMAKTTRYVREQFTVVDKNVIANEYPYVSLLRSRYVFEIPGSQQRLELVLRDSQFLLVSNDKTVRVYDRGEPAYEQVVADVKAFVAGKSVSSGKYTVASNPAVIVPFPITTDDPADPRLSLKPGQVAIEYIAHSCFRIHTAGTRLLIDPYASRTWLGYDFPARLAADEILITHPHYDHDADVLLGGQPAPWTPNIKALRDPGSYKLADVAITGIRGKHADPWGKEFGQTNTIWLLEIGGLRIAHLGDNGRLTDANLQELGRVDILMMPIDSRHHILKEPEIQAIRAALHPRIVIPMHYRQPDLETSPDSPEGLGDIDPWLATQQNVIRLDQNIATFTADALLPSSVIVVFPHSARVTR